MSERRKTDEGMLRHRGDEPHLLREIVRTYQLLLAGVSRETGMPASRFALMRLLAVAGTDLGVMDLARRLGVNPAAVTRQVQELERGNLVARRADGQDKRRNWVRLSSKGRTLFARIHERSHELERAISSAIGKEELAVAILVLGKLRTVLEGLLREPGRGAP